MGLQHCLHWIYGSLEVRTDPLFRLRLLILGYRQYRRLFHKSFNQLAVESYNPVQKAAVNVLLKNLLNDPKAFAGHAHQFVDSFVARTL